MLGIVSSLLLATGFVRAADRLDPMSQELGVNVNGDTANLAAANCSDACSTGCNVLDPNES